MLLMVTTGCVVLYPPKMCVGKAYPYMALPNVSIWETVPASVVGCTTFDLDCTWLSSHAVYCLIYLTLDSDLLRAILAKVRPVVSRAE